MKSRVIAALFGLLLGVTSGPDMAAEAASEDEVTAAFLFNFARYTEWPAPRRADQGSLIRFCFFRAERTAEVFASVLADNTIDGRQVVVKAVMATADLAGCDLVYTNDPAPPWLKSPGHGCLTVGRGDRFVASGGVIALVQQGDHLRFKVNRRAAQAAGITLSSRLLNLAIEVIDE